MTSKWNSESTKGKSDGVYLINLKRMWEKVLQLVPCHWSHWKLANVSVLSSRYTGHQAVLKFAAAPRPALLLWDCVSPGDFTHQIQAVFWEWDFRWLLILGPRTSLSQRPLTLTCLPLLCVTQTNSALWALPFPPTTRELTQWVCDVVLAYEVHTCMAPSLMNTHRRSHLISVHTDPEEIEEEWAGCCSKGCDQRGISVWVDSSAPEFTAAQPRSQTRSAAYRCPGCLLSSPSWRLSTQLPLLRNEERPLSVFKPIS